LLLQRLEVLPSTRQRGAHHHHSSYGYTAKELQKALRGAKVREEVEVSCIVLGAERHHVGVAWCFVGVQATMNRSDCVYCLPLQIKFHPDKVPAAAPLAERVMAEEVSKILNAHNWNTGGR
jgi:hypothetical protein